MVVPPTALFVLRPSHRPAVAHRLGYAERLTLSVKPWSLPIRELRWGRFVSPDDSVVWIEWRGPRPLSLLFHNGAQVEGRISDHRLEWAGTVVDLGPRRILRDGPLVHTALAAVPALHRVVPHGVLETRETKWCSRGELRSAARGGGSAGWAIHEVVCFPEPSP